MEYKENSHPIDDHDVPEHNESGKNAKKDHYHQEHHFDSKGEHDDVKPTDFNFKKSIYTSQRNLIYRMTLTGVFLALAVVGTAVDMGLEFVRIPIAGVNITFRFFDLLFVILSIGSIGPLFATLIAAIIPWIHMGIHAGHGHTVYDALIDFMGYVIVTWTIWFFYYFIFKNSYIHRDPNRKKDLFKRWLPLPFFALICAAVYTGLIIAMLSLHDVFNDDHHEHSEMSSLIQRTISPLHDDHDHDHGHFDGKWIVLIAGLFGFELARFAVCYVSFALIEPQVKKLNHKYR